MNKEKNTGHLTSEEVDAYVNYSLDREGIKDIERRAVKFGEVDLLLEAIMANYELDMERYNELLGEDFFDVDVAVNQDKNENDVNA